MLHLFFDLATSFFGEVETRNGSLAEVSPAEEKSWLTERLEEWRRQGLAFQITFTEHLPQNGEKRIYATEYISPTSLDFEHALQGFAVHWAEGYVVTLDEAQESLWREVASWPLSEQERFALAIRFASLHGKDLIEMKEQVESTHLEMLRYA